MNIGDKTNITTAISLGDVSLVCKLLKQRQRTMDLSRYKILVDFCKNMKRTDFIQYIEVYM